MITIIVPEYFMYWIFFMMIMSPLVFILGGWFAKRKSNKLYKKDHLK